MTIRAENQYLHGVQQYFKSKIIKKSDGSNYEGKTRRKRKGNKGSVNDASIKDIKSTNFGKDASENLGVEANEIEF